MFPLKGRERQYINFYFILLSCGVGYKNADLCTQWEGGVVYMVRLTVVCSQVHIDSCQNPASWSGNVMEKKSFQARCERQVCFLAFPDILGYMYIAQQRNCDLLLQGLWEGTCLLSCKGWIRDRSCVTAVFGSGLRGGACLGTVSLLKLDLPWPALALLLWLHVLSSY